MKNDPTDESKIYLELLYRLHDEIKDFKAEQAGTILENYKGELGKFNRTCSPPSPRKNLSSTAICTYTIAQYSNLWDVTENCTFGFGKAFDSISNYWNHILSVLGDKGIKYMDIEAPDEFTILNVISLLNKIQEKMPQSSDCSK